MNVSPATVLPTSHGADYDRDGVVRVLLVGSMASGKSSVGAVLSELLGWEFADIDLLVERECGMTVPEIFRRFGERSFRDAEARLAARALERDEIVVAPGGGWAAQQPRRLAQVPAGTLSVWLRTDPATAERRILTSDARLGDSRPLLAGPGLRRTLVRLAEEREPCYRQARVRLDTDRMTVLELATEIRAHTLKAKRCPPRRSS